MPVTYFQSNIASDLSGGGNDFNWKLLETSAAQATITLNHAASETRNNYFFTEPGVPGAQGATGNYTVEINVTTGNTSINGSIKLARVDSSGVVKAESAATAEQVLSAGVKTFSFTSLNLGTWGSGDRLRVQLITRNTTTMTRSVTIGVNDANSEIVTPFSVTHSLTANSIDAGTPVLGSPSLQQVYALTANSISAGAPVLGAPSVGQAHVLTASSIAAGAPVLDGPSLIQILELRKVGYNAVGWNETPYNGNGLSLTTSVQATQSVAFDVTNPVTDSQLLFWELRQFVSNNQAVVYYVTVPVGDGQAVMFDVTNSVGDSQALTWDLRQFASDIQALAWELWQLASDNQPIAWELRQFAADSQVLSWELRQFTSDNQALSWELRQFASDSQAMAFDVTNLISDDQALSWELRQFASDSQAMAWRVGMRGSDGASRLTRAGAASRITRTGSPANLSPTPTCGE